MYRYVGDRNLSIYYQNKCMCSYFVFTFPEAQLVPSAAPGATSAVQLKEVELWQDKKSHIDEIVFFRIFKSHNIKPH